MYAISSASTQVNPFLPAIVNMMMDKSAGPIPMFVDEEAPDLKRGRVIIVHGVVYKCVGEPWHYPAGKVVTLRQGDTFKTIKVHTLTVLVHVCNRYSMRPSFYEIYRTSTTASCLYIA